MECPCCDSEEVRALVARLVEAEDNLAKARKVPFASTSIRGGMEEARIMTERNLVRGKIADAVVWHVTNQPEELPVCDACGHKELSHTRTRECMEWKCACERFEPWPSPVAEKSPVVASESPNVAEKSPDETAAATRNVAPDECSICRGRHGLEVQHACE
jgi:hypothetical protein